MLDHHAGQTVFLTLVSTNHQRTKAGLLIDSIRTFGGTLSNCPIWLFETNSASASCGELAGEITRVFPLNIPDTIKGYYFADKVYACHQAEEMALPDVRSLIWISPDCLIIQPPTLFDLYPAFEIALRPVHLQNIGLLADQSLDEFWKSIYHAVGVEDIQSTVQSFVGAQHLRAYFNSHAFSINPNLGLMSKWFECFESMVLNSELQSRICQDEAHQIFLHQAIWSALIVTSLAPVQIRTLPANYSYPYNLHQVVPAERQAEALNDLVSIAYEDRSLNPECVKDIRINEPLRSWLLHHLN